jgi:regulator of replication initiation timing
VFGSLCVAANRKISQNADFLIFPVFCSFTHRFYALLRVNHRTEKSHAALQKQAQSLSEATKGYIGENVALKKENEELKRASAARNRILGEPSPAASSSSSSSSSAAAVASGESIDDRVLTLLAERDAWQQKSIDFEKRVKDTERNFESMKKQAQAQGAEYMRLVSEKESLQRQLEDFTMVLGDARKKKV